MPGWTANTWPAWSHPSSGKAHATDALAATAERARLNGDSSPPAPAFYIHQRDNLETAKAELEHLIPYYIDTAAGIPDFPAIFNAAGSITYYTAAGLFTLCDLPENYLDYTPYSALCGLGWDSADLAAVGHLHGDTNATTAAGGAGNLPTGRSEWFTTDYGWQGVRTAAPYLSHLKKSFTTSVRYKTGNATNSDLATAFSDAVADFNSNSPIAGGTVRAEKTVFAFGSAPLPGLPLLYTVILTARELTLNLDLGTDATLQIYGKGSIGSGAWEYDDDGTDIEQGNYTQIHTATETPGSISITFGDLTAPTALPTTVDATHRTRGYYLNRGPIGDPEVELILAGSFDYT